MRQQAVEFGGVEVQAVFPEVTAFQARVLAQLLEVRPGGELPGVAAEQAAPGIDEAVLVGRNGGAEVQRPGQPRRAPLRRRWS